MKSVLLILGLITVTFAASQGKGQQQSIDSPQEAHQWFEQFLQFAQQYPQQDSAQIQDVQLQFQTQKPSGSFQVQLKFSQGQVSGIFSQAQQYGQSQVQKQGQKRQIQINMQFQRLSVRYNNVDIQTQPQSDVDADYLQGSLQNVRAKLSLQYDQQSGQASFQSLSVQQAQNSNYQLKGAEQQQSQYPQFQQQADKEIQQAVARALQKQVQKMVQQYSYHA